MKKLILFLILISFSSSMLGNTSNPVDYRKYTIQKQQERLVKYVLKRNKDLSRIKNIKRIDKKTAKEIVYYAFLFGDNGYRAVILLAMHEIESGFDPTALSNIGAFCLAQIRYEVWKKDTDFREFVKSKKDLIDPYICIRGQQLILNKYLKRQNYPEALKRYSGNAKNYSIKIIQASHRILEQFI